MNKNMNFYEIFKKIKRPEMGVIISIFVFSILFSFLTPAFITFETLGGIFSMSAYTGIVALGVTLLIISGEFDLSVGAVHALGGMLLAIMIVKLGWNEWVSFLIVIGIALIAGFINGILTLKLRVPSFIITLGMMMFWRGILLLMTGGWPVAYFSPSMLLSLIGAAHIGNLYITTLWWIIILFFLYVLLMKTKYGNWVFATGGNESAAKAQGVNTLKVKMINFILVGGLSGLAGCMEFARLNSANPMFGEGLELEAIAATVIGGTSLKGGYGSVIGAFLGALLVGIIRVGLVLIGAPVYWYRTFVGAILIIAVLINIKIGKIIMW
jgi:simple sugar transport system permease protein